MPCLPSMKYMPKYSGNEYELRIGRCKIDEDKGEYTVKAENSYGKLEASAFLNVEREFYQSYQSNCFENLQSGKYVANKVI